MIATSSSSRLPPTQNVKHLSGISIVTNENINKWISGETEVFFDPHPILVSVTADDNRDAERLMARPLIRKFAHPVMAAVVGVVSSVALSCYVISTRRSVVPLPLPQAKSQPSERRAPSPHSVVPLPTAKAKSQPSDAGTTSKVTRAVGDSRPTPVMPPPTQIIPTLALPTLNQPPTTLSDAKLAAFLREVGLWYDWRMRATPGAERKRSPPQ